MSPGLKDFTVTTFRLLPSRMTIQEAVRSLPPNHIGVVADEKGQPVAVVDSEFLTGLAGGAAAGSLAEPALGLPPAVVVGCQSEMGDVVKGDFLVCLMEGKSPAVVVMDRDTVSGVVPLERIKDFLRSPAYRPTPPYLARGSEGVMGPSASDSELGGSPIVSAVHVRCTTCGFTNILQYLDRAHPPDCQQPDTSIPCHKLTVF